MILGIVFIILLSALNKIMDIKQEWDLPKELDNSFAKMSVMENTDVAGVDTTGTFFLIVSTSLTSKSTGQDLNWKSYFSMAD